MPLSVKQWPDENTIMGSRGCFWIAECEVDGRTFTARSQRGAPHALARELVKAGIPDDAMVVISQGLVGDMTYRSFHRMAGFTYGESSTVRLSRVPYRELPTTTARGKGGAVQEQG